MRTSSIRMPDKKGRRRFLCALAVPLLLTATSCGAAQDEPQPRPAPGTTRRRRPSWKTGIFAAHLRAGYTEPTSRAIAPSCCPTTRSSPARCSASTCST